MGRGQCRLNRPGYYCARRKRDVYCCGDRWRRLSIARPGGELVSGQHRLAAECDHYFARRCWDEHICGIDWVIQGGVFRSDDQGKSWFALDTGFSNAGVNEVAAVGTDIFAVLSDGRVIRSSSQGEKWALVNTGLPLNTRVTSFAVVGTNIFAGTSNQFISSGGINGGVIRS